MSLKMSLSRRKRESKRSFTTSFEASREIFRAAPLDWLDESGLPAGAGPHRQSVAPSPQLPLLYQTAADPQGNLQLLRYPPSTCLGRPTQVGSYS